MASCPKCGKGGIRKRKNVRKCKHCGPMPWNGIGNKPVDNLTVDDAVNPFGSCFDAAACNLLANIDDGVKNMKMCHGIGISNHPDSMGKKICHAWVEFDHPKCRVAVDPIFLIAQPAEFYRQNFKAEIVVEYTEKEFVRLWKEKGFPGPFDKNIAALTKDAA